MFVLVASATALDAQSTGRRTFTVGERAEYDIRYGPMHVGTGSLTVMGIDTVRGRDSYRFRLTADARVNLLVKKFSSRDTMQSWVDTATFHSLRFHQDQLPNGRPRTKRYEIFPERLSYTDGNQPEQPSVADPLDDIAFLYFVRTQGFEVGTTMEWSRYFEAKNNPVVLKVLRKDTIEAAGRNGRRLWFARSSRPRACSPTVTRHGSGFPTTRRDDRSAQHEALGWIDHDAIEIVRAIEARHAAG